MSVGTRVCKCDYVLAIDEFVHACEFPVECECVYECGGILLCIWMCVVHLRGCLHLCVTFVYLCVWELRVSSTMALISNLSTGSIR